MDGHKAPMTARSPRPTASSVFYSKLHAGTKLPPVVQLRSGVMLLMGGRPLSREEEYASMLECLYKDTLHQSSPFEKAD
jgi:hypothetical protein